MSVELNADPSSSDQYSQGFAFYHTLSSGQEIEQFDITQRDKIHRLANLIDGRLKLLVDGVVKYEADSETFNTDMFIINGFNDYNSNGLAFELEVDNVRVLRRSQQAEELDPVTVVSDPNGNPVVVQVGDEYNWNNSLDGVTLWTVEWEEGDAPDAGTARFTGGEILYGFEFYDEVADLGTNKDPYEIDENGC